MSDELARKRELRDLACREPDELSAAELIDVLTDRYGPVQVPPCRVCGGPLSCQAAGGGEPTVYACSGRDEDCSMLPGRTPADDHYSQSRWLDYRRGGDDLVMELIRRSGLAPTPQRDAGGTE